MTREEERKQRAKEIFYLPISQAIFMCGAEWADKTMINKACEWLRENVNDYIFNDGKEWMSDWKVDIKEMLDDFKKAMEE